jgi:Methyltransferase FkbM domain
MRGIIRFIQKSLRKFGLVLTSKHVMKFNIPVIVSLRALNASRISLLESLRPKDNGYSLLRLGSANDGGYLIPNDLAGIEYCFSPGCGDKWDFEKDLLAKFRIQSFILDSETSKPANLDPGIEFDIGWLGSRDSAKFITLESWIKKHFQNSPDQMILQMDIENAEWECLRSMKIETLNRFRILVIEFHSFDLLNHARFYNSFMEPVFHKLLNSFEVVHTHANNCCGLFDFLGYSLPRVLEVTFHNRSRSNQESGSSTKLKYRDIPNALDRPNVATKDEIVFSWQERQ